jgi:hypothetical protein
VFSARRKRFIVAGVPSMTLQMYRAFMIGYVRRINEATLRVPINGIRIGHAKTTFMAQIDLTSGIITFSRYAIENVPEHCRRYLVIHELSHVKEARHNKRFWNIVGKYVPDCRKVEHELQEAFNVNIHNENILQLPDERDVMRRLENPNLGQLSETHRRPDGIIRDPIHMMIELSEEQQDSCFGSADDEFGAWTNADEGVVCGGYD